jgi:hypothetical protein
LCMKICAMIDARWKEPAVAISETITNPAATQ